MRVKQSKRIDEPSEIKVVIYGVGEMGTRIARLLLEKEGVKIVGAIDTDPTKIGRDLGDVIGIEDSLDIAICDNPNPLLSAAEPDIVVHTTSSFIKDVYEQLKEIIRHRANLVSTCEELVFPYVLAPDSAMEIDNLAKKNNVTILGTGINPGFVMDTLVITLTGVCQDIKRIKIERTIDANKRRLSFQKKIGIGLTVEEFREKIENKKITGHVGLKQSIAMIADALNLDRLNIEIGKVEPIIAEKNVKSENLEVESGKVAGLKQSACGILDSKSFLTIDFQAYLVAEEEYDSITIEGKPSINQKITPCIHGDLATSAIIVNSIPKVITASAGLKTMKDFSIPSIVMRDMRLHLKEYNK